MDSLTRPSRVARGPGLPALQAHNSPNAPPAMTRPDSSRSRQRYSSATHNAGWNHGGSISARAAAADCPRAVSFVHSGNDRFDCVALAACPGRSATRHADARLRWLLAVRCGPGTVPHTACATVPVLQRAALRPGDALVRLARDDDRYGFLESQCARVVRPGSSSQTLSASRIRFVIASGCEISARWLASISIVFAPIRLAMKRSRSGLIVRSWVDTA
jgi:hypothetical protein